VRIVSVSAVPVRVPLAQEFTSALGTSRATEAGVLRVTTDDGQTGLGEIALTWHGDGGQLCSVVNEVLAPALVGMDPFDVVRIREVTSATFAFGRHSLTAVAAVEMALLDLQGRALGVPGYRLLGGLARDRVELSMSLPIAAVASVVAQARAYADQGFGAVKVKAGDDADHCVETVAAVRAALGDAVKIRVDLNMACAQAKAALALMRRLEPHGVISVEQPLPADDLEGLALLRARSPLPVMADESVWSPADAWEVLRRGAADLVNVYVSEAGGPFEARRIIDLCALAHTGVVIGSMPELGIGTAAAAHVAFAAARIDQPSDVAGHLYHARDVVSPGSLRIAGGYLLPPQGVGLGVELDEDALAELRTDRNGPAGSS
jgi:L-alanine-DL-glutamate epimerase-like enolase superfamily enzyme